VCLWVCVRRVNVRVCMHVCVCMCVRVEDEINIVVAIVLRPPADCSLVEVSYEQKIRPLLRAPSSNSTNASPCLFQS